MSSSSTRSVAAVPTPWPSMRRRCDPGRPRQRSIGAAWSAGFAAALEVPVQRRERPARPPRGRARALPRRTRTARAGSCTRRRPTDRNPRSTCASARRRRRRTVRLSMPSTRIEHPDPRRACAQRRCARCPRASAAVRGVSSTTFALALLASGHTSRACASSTSTKRNEARRGTSRNALHGRDLAAKGGQV